MAALFRTLEMRWFWPADDSRPAWAWFAGGGDPPPSETRTDSYLVLPGVEATGVKLREESLEVKALGEEPGLWRGPAGPCGKRQFWVKWSLAGTGLPIRAGDRQGAGEWRRVTKERRQRQFIPCGAGGGGISSPLAEMQRSCQVELTRVTVENREPAWLTLGFEAFGEPDAGLLVTLEATAEAFFRDRGPPPASILTLANSLSYPAWLNRLGPAPGRPRS